MRERIVSSGIKALSTLFDTNIQSPTNGQALTYNSTSQKWENSTVSSGSAHIIQDEGVSLTARTKLNFIGTGVVATDNAGTGATDVTITSGGGSGTVTSVGSADGSITVTNPTTTPDLTVVKAPKLTTARTISLTGDVTHTSTAFDGSADITGAATLATVNSNVGSFGSASSVSTFTVNAKGLITAAASTAISITASAVSDFSSAVAALITGKADKTTTISTTAPLSGGGDLSTNRTLTTSMATNKLIGRGTAGTGVMEEITLGTNLSLTGTTLNATGGGGTTITTQDEGSTLSTTVTTLNFTGAGVTASGAGATTTINIPGGSGSLTKGIAEVDFGASTTESDIATVTVNDAAITSTSYPSVSLYALATTDHDSDDYMAEGLIPYISSITNGVGFNISVRAPNLSWGKYKVTYQY